MIRLVYALRRKSQMSLADFQRYWSDIHGPLVARHSTTLNILRYVQLHTLDDPINSQLAGARGSMEPPYDGVAELWYTSREAFAGPMGKGAGQTAGRELFEDEKRFIDLANSPLWLAYEYPQVNPSEEILAREHGPLVKLFFCLHHPQNMTLEQAQLYWRTQHGPTIRGVAQGMRLRRYLQVHRFEDGLEGQLRTSRGTHVAPYAGHAEAWFERAEIASLSGSPEARHAMEIAVEDEAKFIDFARSAIFVGKERTFIDRR